ncbi:hypothetical protein BDV93DRAFT_236839 [Ceratobasidium sp. AG-I]|nr:hypothetical protein BDV93DRAFT_236839 [Ceratobasidium sp. AG-I]
MSNQIEPHGPLSTGRLDPVSDQGALSSIVFPSRSITPEGHDFPIDRTSIDFYSARQLRSALLHHPGIEKDKKNIYIESASYCRQQQKGAREFIIFNVHNTTSGQTASSVLLLDPGIESHTSSSVSCSDSHSARCLPLLFNLMKPSFWKSLKNPGCFYFPGCLENILESRGLAAYQELEKIVFEHEKPFDIESFVVLASVISSPSSLYQKKLAQTPFWFPIILWNLMKRFPSNVTLMPGAAADMVQKLTPGNVDKLLKRFHVELAKFRIELGANLSGRDAQSSDTLSTSSEESSTLQSMSQEHEQTLLQPPGVSYVLQTELQEMPNLPSSLQVPRDLSVQEMFDSLVKDGCADLSTLIDFDSFSQCAIANGGFGEVWKTQMKDGDPVAVKCLRSLTDDKKGKKRAMRELNHWSKAHHENIQELLGIIMFQGRLGMVSKWMENGDLRQFIEKNPDADRYQLCLQVATGISYLHGIGMVGICLDCKCIYYTEVYA